MATPVPAQEWVQAFLAHPENRGAPPKVIAGEYRQALTAGGVPEGDAAQGYLLALKAAEDQVGSLAFAARQLATDPRAFVRQGAGDLRRHLSELVERGIRGSVDPRAWTQPLPEGGGTGFPGMVGETVGGMVPQTPEGLLGMAAAGPISRIGVGGHPLLSAGARLATAGALGAGTAAATGGDPTTGALETGGGQAVGEAIRGGSTMMEALTNLRARGTVNRFSEYAKETLQGIIRDVPAYLRAIPQGKITSNEQAARVLHNLREREVGQRVLSQHFGRVEDLTVAALGTPRTLVPAPATAAYASHVAGTPPPGPSARQEVGEVLRLMKLANEEAINAAPGPSGNVVREMADAIQREYLALVTQQNPALARQFQQEWGAYRRGKMLQTALRESDAFKQGRGTGAAFDAAALREYLETKHPEWGQTMLPNTWRGLLPPGSRPGAQDVRMGLTDPSAYLGGVRVRSPLSLSYQLEPLGTRRTRWGLNPTRPTGVPGAIAATGVLSGLLAE